MKTLDEIAIKHGTDKATSHPVKGHGYAPYYSRVFDPIRHDPIKFLEIGVGGGESIRTWLEYFDNASVFGVDNVQGTNPWNTVGVGAHLRYKFVYGDQSDETFWKCFVVDYGSNWGVIVDDGGHTSRQVGTTHKMMWPHIGSGGLYCIEDLGVSLDAGSVFLTPGWPGHLTLIESEIKKLHRGSDVDLMQMSKELAIFRKL